MPPNRTIRVASVPSSHPYPQALERSAAGRVRLLPDPPPADGASDRWWPPRMLSSGWIEQNAEDFDVMHLHFGMESVETRIVDDALRSLERMGKPLVYTVHDLENPQLSDQGRHVEQLDLIIPRATALTTLTPGAADEVRQRWGRAAEVIPHPTLLQQVPSFELTPPHRPRAMVHLSDLRPNIDGLGTVISLRDALASGQLAWLDVVVDMNDVVRDPRQARAIEQVVAGHPQLAVQRHSRYSDDELLDSLAAAEIAVLPYSHGTHSGWAELAWDLGLSLLTRDVGYIHEQHPDDTVVFVEDSVSSLIAGLYAAVGLATLSGSRARALAVDKRRRERSARDAHSIHSYEKLYVSLAGE